MKKLVRISIISFTVLAMSAVTFARNPNSQGPERGRAFEHNLAGLALGNADVSTLVDIILFVDSEIEEAGLVELLSGRRHYTAFAPTNDAFGALFDTVDSLPAACQPDLSDPDVLLSVLEYHLARGDKRASGLINSGSVRMLNDDVALIGVDGDGAFIHNFPDDARIESADIRASNGILHLINRVLIPPAVAQGIQDCILSQP